MNKKSKEVIAELYKKYGSITKLNNKELIKYRTDLVNKLEYSLNN